MTLTKIPESMISDIPEDGLLEFLDNFEKSIYDSWNFSEIEIWNKNVYKYAFVNFKQSIDSLSNDSELSCETIYVNMTTIKHKIIPTTLLGLLWFKIKRLLKC